MIRLAVAGFAYATSWMGFLGQAAVPDPSGLAQFGLVGAILAVTFAFVWFVVKGYRGDLAEVRSENRDLNTYLRERVVPLIEANGNALKDTSASNAEVAKALAQVTFVLTARQRD